MELAKGSFSGGYPRGLIRRGVHCGVGYSCTRQQPAQIRCGGRGAAIIGAILRILGGVYTGDRGREGGAEGGRYPSEASTPTP